MNARSDNQPQRNAATVFEQINSLADNAALFTETEHKIMLKAISHANRETGDVTLSASSFAACADRDERFVKRILNQLATRGYLPVVKRGGGRNITSVRHVKLPFSDRSRVHRNQVGATGETVALQDTVSSNLNSGAGEHETVSCGALNSVLGAHETVALQDTRTSIRTTKEQSSATAAATPPNGDAVAGGEFHSGEEKEIRRLADESLIRHGIGQPTRSQLLDSIPGLTAAAVNELARMRGKGAGVGVLVTMIRADGAKFVARQEIERRLRVEFQRAENERQQKRSKLIAERVESQSKIAETTRQRTAAVKTWLHGASDEELGRIVAEYVGCATRMDIYSMRMGIWRRAVEEVNVALTSAFQRNPILRLKVAHQQLRHIHAVDALTSRCKTG
jgi:hypothetical protein